MSVSFFNNGVMHSITSYTQCQCCGKYSAGYDTLCEQCNKDAIDVEHQKDLEKVYNFFRQLKFSEIIEILKKCNHLTRTKLIYGECFLRLQKYDELEEFLDDWLEESFMYNDLDGYYVFILKLGGIQSKHKKSHKEIYDIIEQGGDRRLSNELWAHYYHYKALDKFSPFTPQEFFEIMNKALNYAINTQPFVMRGLPGMSNNFITFSKNGKRRSTYQIPVNFYLVGQLFYSAGEHFLKIKDLKNVYDTWKKAIEVLLQDEWFSYGQSALRAYSNQAILESNYTEAMYSTNLLKRLIMGSIMDGEDYLTDEERLLCISMILNTHDYFLTPQEGLEYLEEVEQRYNLKNKFRIEKAHLFRDLGEYNKATEEYMANYEEKITEKNSSAVHSYVYFLLCRLLDRELKPIELDMKVFDNITDQTEVSIYKTTYSVLNNNLQGKYQESLTLLDNDSLKNIYNFLLIQLLANEKICCYYNLWIKNKKSTEYYDKLKTLIVSSLDNGFLSRNQNANIFRRKIQLLLLQIIAKEKIDLKNEIGILQRVVQPLGFKPFLEFLDTFQNTKVNDKNIRKKLEANYTTYVRNMNNLLRSKNW